MRDGNNLVLLSITCLPSEAVYLGGTRTLLKCLSADVERSERFLVLLVFYTVWGCHTESGPPCTAEHKSEFFVFYRLQMAHLISTWSILSLCSHILYMLSDSSRQARDYRFTAGLRPGVRIFTRVVYEVFMYLRY